MRTDRPPRWLRLGDGERFVQSAGANRTTGRTAAGGWLALTSWRVVHHTHVFERASTGTPDWEAALSDIADIADVGLVDPGGLRQAFTGGLRQRLRITTSDGTETLFVVNAVQDWRDAVHQATRQISSD